MSQDFYPFVEDANGSAAEPSVVRHPARIAVYDDASAAPRVVVVEPKDVRAYLEEITLQVSQLAQGQGGSIPFMVIREIVENFIHAYFMEPTISILNHGNTIRFSDQGPGIREKERALQYGTTSATEEMRRYIRGVGSGLPYAQQYMLDKGGRLEIEDNIAGGTIVTISLPEKPEPSEGLAAGVPQQAQPQMGQSPWPAQQPYQQAYQQPYQQQYPPPPQQQQQWWWPQQPYPQPQQQGYPPQQPWPPQQGYPPQQQGWPRQEPQLTDQTVWPQQQGWPQQPVSPPQVPSQAASQLFSLTPRGRAIMDYLAEHDSVGPSDLARTYGESQPTWTRELQALEEQGLVRKDGQKRRLTTLGKTILQS